MISKFRAVIKGNKGKNVLIYSKDHDVTFNTNYAQFWRGLTKYKISYKNILQSTGLKDYKGVEIFEGDVVKRTSLIPGGFDLIGVVKMLEGCWVIDDGTQAIALWTEVDENIVIGNIYENPELVEVE